MAIRHSRHAPALMAMRSAIALGNSTTSPHSGQIHMLRALYGEELIYERHRHRYEFNNVYRQQFAANGMRISGTSPDGSLVEVVELPEHPWFVAVQYHPEFKSQPTVPQPLFAGLVGAAVSRNKTKGERPATNEPAGEQPVPAPKASPARQTK